MSHFLGSRRSNRLFESYERKVNKFGKRKKFLRIINLPLELFSKGAFSNFPPRVSLRLIYLEVYRVYWQVYARLDWRNFETW